MKPRMIPIISSTDTIEIYKILVSFMLSPFTRLELSTRLSEIMNGSSIDRIVPFSSLYPPRMTIFPLLVFAIPKAFRDRICNSELLSVE
jgi:hypothetical protein